MMKKMWLVMLTSIVNNYYDVAADGSHGYFEDDDNEDHGGDLNKKIMIMEILNINMTIMKMIMILVIMMMIQRALGHWTEMKKYCTC